MMNALEHELKQLLAGNRLRQQVEDARTGTYWVEEGNLVPVDPIDAAVIHGWERNEEILEALYDGKKLGPTWEELVQLYIRVKARTRARPIAHRTIKAVQLAVNRVVGLCQPKDLNKQHVQRLIGTMEQTLRPVTVRQQLSLLSSVITVAIRNDALDIVNPFTQVDYTAVQDLQVRRAYTDAELRLLDGPLLWLVLTGMRPAELATRTPGDIDAGVIIIKAADGWRPKTLNSERRVPLPTGVEIKGYSNWNSELQRWRKQLRKLITDTTVTPHSGRHTFAELGRRSGVEPRVMEALMGHGSSVGAASTRAYGQYTDDVLHREMQKVWALVDNIREHRRPV